VPLLHQLTILGAGLLGGSLGLAARQRRLAGKVVIWARRPEVADDAWRLGAADEATIDLSRAVSGAGLVIFATPMGAMRPLAEQIRSVLPRDCVVSDVGSVKYPVVNELTAIFPRFIGAHPMAGSEQSGLEAARRDLFQAATCILTPRADSDPSALQLVHDFWVQLGCQVRTLPPQQHDEIVARVSHLPHLVAAAVVNLVCRDDDRLLNFVGPGFKDFSRIASGPAELWTEIALQNRQEIARALEQLIEELTRLRGALHNADAGELKVMLKRAKHYRDELRFRS
jgi:prephenate dehydrogenase